MVDKIVSVWFDHSGEQYKRLMNVFSYSIKKNTNYDLEVLEIDPPKVTRKKSLDNNSVKLYAWVDWLKNTDAENIVFMDCDMVVLKPFDDVFHKEFDVCYTYRKNLPLNGGVVFARNNQYTIDFFTRWAEINQKMMETPSFHVAWSSKYAGINQAAFGYLLENNPDCSIEAVPCKYYNAVDEHWRNIHEDCRAIHYKSELRRAVVGSRFAPWIQNLVDLWNQYEREGKANSLIK